MYAAGGGRWWRAALADDWHRARSRRPGARDAGPPNQLAGPGFRCPLRDEVASESAATCAVRSMVDRDDVELLASFSPSLPGPCTLAAACGRAGGRRPGTGPGRGSPMGRRRGSSEAICRAQQTQAQWQRRHEQSRSSAASVECLGYLLAGAASCIRSDSNSQLLHPLALTDKGGWAGPRR